jgi:hypothetical protein
MKNLKEILEILSANAIEFCFVVSPFIALAMFVVHEIKTWGCH